MVTAAPFVGSDGKTCSASVLIPRPYFLLGGPAEAFRDVTGWPSLTLPVAGESVGSACSTITKRSPEWRRRETRGGGGGGRRGGWGERGGGGAGGVAPGPKGLGGG